MTLLTIFKLVSLFLNQEYLFTIGDEKPMVPQLSLNCPTEQLQMVKIPKSWSSAKFP